MSKYVTTGSAIERVWHCRQSIALPHANHETKWSERGTVLHQFLEDVAAHGSDEALELVPSEYRATARALDLSELGDQLDLAAEVAIAYDCTTDTARELGRGAGRCYDDVTEDEIPCTLDVIGSRQLPDGRLRGLVVDWKFGWKTRKRVDTHWQLNFGALAAARAFGFDIVEIQLIHPLEDAPPIIQRALMTAWDLDRIAGEIRQLHAEALAARAEMAAGVMPKTWNTGPWCDNCPSKMFCPAQQALLRSVMAGDEFDQVLRVRPMEPEVAAQAWHRLQAAKKMLAMLEGTIRGMASQSPIYLGELDGKHAWLGTVKTPGRTMLNGDAAYEVIAELHGEDAATAATKLVATQKDVKAALSKVVKRGQGAAAMREVLARLGQVEKGITRNPGTKVDVFTTTTRELPAAAPEDVDAGDDE